MLLGEKQKYCMRLFIKNKPETKLGIVIDLNIIQKSQIGSNRYILNRNKI